MKKHFIYLLLIGLMIISGCNKPKQNDDGIIEINITEALENQLDFPLSKLVKDVEILEIESNVECYIEQAQVMFFGQKHILIFDWVKTQLFLFNRQGKFIRKIGNQGKGPGEYSGMMFHGTMSKDEKKIIITNSNASRVIVYNTMGEVLAQKDLGQHFSYKNILGLECHFDNLLSFLPHRPLAPTDEFSSLEFFDLDLNKAGSVLPRINDETLTAKNINHTNLFDYQDKAYFWEMYNDTIYQFLEDGSSSPKYKFTTEKNNLSKDKIFKDRWSVDIYENTFAMRVNIISGFLLAHISNTGSTVLYNLKNGKSFSIGRKIVCLEDKDDKGYDTIENDIFGFEPIKLWQYVSNQNICVEQFDWSRYSTMMDLDCIKSLDVANPEIRDQLIEYCENPTDNLGTVLVLMHMK